MNRLSTVLLSSAFLAGFTMLPLAAAPTASAATLSIAENDAGAPLTITGAKRAVTRMLEERGANGLSAGRAAFDRDGNVSVEVVNSQGIGVSHVIVDAKTGQVAAARTHAPLTKKG